MCSLQLDKMLRLAFPAALVSKSPPRGAGKGNKLMKILGPETPQHYITKLNAEQKNEHLKDLLALYDGLKMTESILMNTLKKHGLERFDPSLESEKFNPNEHEATFMTPMQGKEDNTVFLTQQKGFKLNGRILRAAKVGVVKNS